MIGAYFVKTKEGNFVVDVDYDSYPENPRNWCNLSKMLFTHKRYNLGDVGLWDELGISPGSFFSWDEVESWIWKHEDPLFTKQVYMTDHGGLYIHVEGCPGCNHWDSGIIGIQYVKKSDARKWFGVKRITSKIREKVIDVARYELEIYSKYVMGDVYVIRICGVDFHEIVGGFFLDGEEELKQAVLEISGINKSEFIGMQHLGESWQEDIKLFCDRESTLQKIQKVEEMLRPLESYGIKK